MFQCKWQAHAHDIKKGRQPGEFQGPTGCAWSTPPTSAPMTGTKDVSNVGFSVAKVDDGLDYGSDDDYDPEKEHPLANFKSGKDEPKDDEEWWEKEGKKVAPKTPHPDLVVADTMNNRIQYIPDDSSQVRSETKREGRLAARS